jgi:SynChlorMet cassette protein ScmC
MCVLDFNPVGYKLSIGDGNNWWITGDKDTAQFVDNISFLMNLEKCTWDSSPRIIFFNKIKEYRNKLLEQGWEFYDYRIVCIWHNLNSDDVICEIELINEPKKYLSMSLVFIPIYQKIINNGGMLFHSALIEIEGQGVLLSAPSDTGKSTCCSRVPYPWKPLCDDEVLIVLDKQNKYHAYPFPTWRNYLNFSSDSYNVQHSVPISCIFFLEQSVIDKVTPLKNSQSAIRIYELSANKMKNYWSLLRRDDLATLQRLKIFSNAVEMSKHIPVFRLEARLDGNFWEEMGKAINLGV